MVGHRRFRRGRGHGHHGDRARAASGSRTGRGPPRAQARRRTSHRFWPAGRPRSLASGAGAILRPAPARSRRGHRHRSDPPMIRFLGRTHDRELVLDQRDGSRVGAQPSTAPPAGFRGVGPPRLPPAGACSGSPSYWPNGSMPTGRGQPRPGDRSILRYGANGHGRPAACRNPGLLDDSGLASASRPRIARGPQAPGQQPGHPGARSSSPAASGRPGRAPVHPLRRDPPISSTARGTVPVRQARRTGTPAHHGNPGRPCRRHDRVLPGHHGRYLRLGGNDLVVAAAAAGFPGKDYADGRG